MSDILLLYAAGKKGVAGQLADALGASGYAVTQQEVADDDGASVPDRAQDAVAALLIWSRPLVSSAQLERWLRKARSLPQLIEVSSDGITPAGDESRVVLLSGWRGQPFHPGWQRISARLKELCGPVKAAPAPAPRQAAPRADGAKAGGSGKRIFLPAAIGVALLAGIAAVAWPHRDAAQSDATAAPVTTEAPPASAPTPAPVQAAEPPQTAAAPVAEPAPPIVPAETPAPKLAKPRTVRHKPATAAAAGPVKRYSPRNSKTMRLFCARSGRGTPQCQTFLRSTGGD